MEPTAAEPRGAGLGGVIPSITLRMTMRSPETVMSKGQESPVTSLIALAASQPFMKGISMSITTT
jgi:hypothetical protein